MNCQDVLDRLGEYWDLADQDPAKAEMDRHIRECESCREEFAFWKESVGLIQSVREPAVSAAGTGSISGKVMDLIYQTESWRKPVALHTYSLSWRVRRNIMACFAMCLAIFFVSFLYSLLPDATDAGKGLGFSIKVETAVAQDGGLDIESDFFEDTPVVSISPAVLFVPEQAKTYANFYLAGSIFGVVITLLLMNWLSRLRA